MNKCKTCKHLLTYYWMGEGYRREVHSCREHLPLYPKECKLYKEDKK